MIDFHGWDARGLWDEIKFDVKHFSEIERLAVVGDKTWEKCMAELCDPFVHAAVRFFPPEKADAAREWLGRASDAIESQSQNKKTMSNTAAETAPSAPAASILMHSAGVGVFKSNTAAEEAVKRLQSAGFNMTHLSIVGQDYHTENHVIGFYNTCDRMKLWSKYGAFWGGIWGLLIGAAFLILPGIGPVVVAGPFAASIIGAIEGAIVVSGLSALGAALISIGIPKDSVLRYEHAIKAGSYLLVARGSDAELAAIEAELARSGEDQDFTIHGPTPATPEPATVGA
jgi:hypothetical protein